MESFFEVFPFSIVMKQIDGKKDFMDLKKRSTVSNTLRERWKLFFFQNFHGFEFVKVLVTIPYVMCLVSDFVLDLHRRTWEYPIKIFDFLHEPNHKSYLVAHHSGHSDELIFFQKFPLRLKNKNRSDVYVYKEISNAYIQMRMQMRALQKFPVADRFLAFDMLSMKKENNNTV